MNRNIKKVNYLAALDTGNASIRWPQKDSLYAGQHQESFSREIERILKLNLMWRRSVALRHFDVFDNLALAKFLNQNETVCNKLSQAGLLLLCSPKTGSFG